MSTLKQFLTYACAPHKNISSSDGALLSLQDFKSLFFRKNLVIQIISSINKFLESIFELRDIVHAQTRDGDRAWLVLKCIDGLDSGYGSVPQHPSPTMRSPRLSYAWPKLESLDDEVDDLVLIRLFVIVMFDDPKGIDHNGQEHVDEDERHDEHETEEEYWTKDTVCVAQIKERRPAKHDAQKGG